jgi:myo-inositol-1(or 4)-monophosphatase
MTCGDGPLFQGSSSWSLEDMPVARAALPIPLDYPTPMIQLSPELAMMIDAARRAGAGLMNRFRSRDDLHVSLKGPADFVSVADLESEQTLRSMLLGAYGAFGFFTEESAPTAGTDPSTRFIVDPLDGTTNFLHGLPHFAVAIALERDGRVVAGVVFDPPKDELFAAEEGRGAWRGPERLRVSGDVDLSRAIVGTGIPHSSSLPRHAAYLPQLAATMREAAGIRRLGAAALDLAYVAAGRFAAFFEYGLSPWDIAAGALLVREAGGRVSEPSGGENVLSTGNVLATNGRLHEHMRGLLAETAG